MNVPMKFIQPLLRLSAALILITTNVTAQELPPIAGDSLTHPVASQTGMVVAEEKIASAIGADILAKGGNAIDAAVATAFALSVTFPRAGNIGGGGFMMIYLAEEDRSIALDYREMAPMSATRDMYLDENGAVDNEQTLFSHKSAGVPGTVAGLLHAHEKYGKLSRREVMAPAISLAKSGYELSYFKAAMFAEYRSRFLNDQAAAQTFLKEDGTIYQPGERMKRPALAKTLKAIAKKGRAGFYDGWVAKAIAEDMAENGGLITLDDLANYRVVEREPIKGTYRGFEIHSMPPPSSGGIHLVQILNILEQRDAPQYDNAEDLHYLAESMRSAFADRAEHLGDSDFVDVPTKGLISKKYAEHLANSIGTKARKSRDLNAGNPAAYESTDTTHISVIDRDGNMVANTYTLNLSFGSGIVVPGTGILLNNEMDDFSAAPNTPNAYGLVGGTKNAIEAGKRPLSSMTPTLILHEGEPWVATGAPGGSKIITGVLQVIINIIDDKMNIAAATARPRLHHQWLPDTLFVEPGFSADTIALLEKAGHKVEPLDGFSRVQTVLHKDGWFYGATDLRMPGGGACSPGTTC